MVDPITPIDDGIRFSVLNILGDGVKTDWEINFSGGYIRREHIKAYVTQPSGVNEPTALAWLGPNTVQIVPPVPNGYAGAIYRDTPKDAPLVDFTDGAIISEQTLDITTKQAVFAAAEMVDKFATTGLSAGNAIIVAQAAIDLAETTIDIADTANTNAATALATANSVEAQFDALAADVEDVLGGDVSNLARKNVAQTFTEAQAFVDITVQGSLNFYGSDFYRSRPNSGEPWETRRLNYWPDLIDKPATFPPASHTHAYGSLTGIPTTFAPSAHTHPWSEVTGKPAVEDAITKVNQLYLPGEIKQGLFAVVPSGWIVPDGTTIGNASSGAGRANADTVELYTQLWALDPAVAPILTSAGSASTRGASAAADFAANKRLTVPDLRGVFLRSLDLSRGLDPARVLGSFQLGQNEAHSHTVMAGVNDTPNTNLAAGSGSEVGTTTTSTEGGTEARPVNVAVRIIIKL